MDKFEQELAQLINARKGYGIPYTEVVRSTRMEGRQFIHTRGHGYLVIAKGTLGYSIAKGIVDYGYQGQLAIYLEEDCEVPAFFSHLPGVGNKYVTQG